MHWIPQQGKDVVCCRKDGAPIHMTLWTAPLQDADANIRGKLSILADTSESHRAQLERAQLLNSERDAREYARSMDRFRELLEAAPDAIIETDAQGKIVLLNAATEQIFGYSRDELLGKPIDQLVPQELRNLYAQHRSEYAAAPVRRPMGMGVRLQAQRKDGTRFPVEISLSRSRAPKVLVFHRSFATSRID